MLLVSHFDLYCVVDRRVGTRVAEAALARAPCTAALQSNHVSQPRGLKGHPTTASKSSRRKPWTNYSRPAVGISRRTSRPAVGNSRRTIRPKATYKDSNTRYQIGRAAGGCGVVLGSTRKGQHGAPGRRLRSGKAPGLEKGPAATADLRTPGQFYY